MTSDGHSKQMVKTLEPAGDGLAVGTLLSHGQFRIERFLNSGGFGMTYLARNSLDRLVVIKECFPSFLCFRKGENVAIRSNGDAKSYHSLVSYFRAEARALSRLDHPNIVGVHEVFDDNNTAYMTLDFVEGRDLQEIVEFEPDRLGPHELRRVLVAVLGAVSYIHEQGVLHRDISPDNILLDRHNYPILIDFGSARESVGSANCAETRLQAVKDGYSPHEFYSRKLAHSAASDLYALGATFHYAIVGEAPPSSQYRVAGLIENGKDPYRPLKGRISGFDNRLLESIDRSLAIVSRDRPQSAREWLLEIDDQSRKVAALEKARNDERIEQIVRDLVLESNLALEEQDDEPNLVDELEAPNAVASSAGAMTRSADAVLADAIPVVTKAEVHRAPEALSTAMETVVGEAPQQDEIDEIGQTDGPHRQPVRVHRPVVAKRRRPTIPSGNRAPLVAPEPKCSVKPDLNETQKPRSRRSFKINWVLPPLYVSGSTQLSGKVE